MKMKKKKKEVSEYWWTDPPWERKSVSCVNLFLLQKLTVTKWNSSDTVNTKTEFLSYFWSDSDFLADF